MSETKRTPLYDLHKECGAKIIDFGGWDMPVSYNGTLKEHAAVRENCGLFDVSHMGEVFVQGPQAVEFCQKITTNNVAKLTVGQGQYTTMLNESGGVIDDLILYRVEDARYLLCINASNTAKDVAWIEKQAASFDQLMVKNASDDYAQLALQGPNSKEILSQLVSDSQFENLNYTHIGTWSLFGEKSYIARTGYTGEWGYEIYCSPTVAQKLWKTWVMDEGSQVVPCGLGARDTLRLEACYPLYGNEMDEAVTPLEIGVGWAVKPGDKDFIGKDSLAKQSPERELIAFQLIDKGIARSGMNLLINEQEIGKVTSGSMLPTLGFPGGLALVKRGQVAIGDEIGVDVRGKIKLAKVMKKPLYSARVK